MIELKSRTELDAIGEAGRAAAAALRAVRQQVRAGVRLCELDEIARAALSEAGAEPARPAHRPGLAVSGAIATSVNDAIVHGVPDRTRLAEGDLLGLECGARVGGWCALTAATVPVGAPDPADARLVTAADQALQDGIAAAHPGVRLGEVCAAIGIVGRGGGYGMPGPLGGHGIGRDVREEPVVPNEGRPGRGPVLRPGLVLVLAPVLTAGGRDDLDVAGPAVRTGDGSRAAHAARTVAITTAGPRVLT